MIEFCPLDSQLARTIPISQLNKKQTQTIPTLNLSRPTIQRMVLEVRILIQQRHLLPLLPHFVRFALEGPIQQGERFVRPFIVFIRRFIELLYVSTLGVPATPTEAVIVGNPSLPADCRRHHPRVVLVRARACLDTPRERSQS